MRRVLHLSIGLVLVAAMTTRATADCVICARSVVMNEELATCFLQKYADPAATAGETVAIDLSRCERSRSVVLALPEPVAPVEQPDTRFLLSRTQVECLRDKLEADEIDLDPSARIDLGGCR